MSRRKELQRELNARIPRKARGSLQNDFRQHWWFFRVQGNSFEASSQLALDTVREKCAEFVPLILL